ncbi:MAG: efflux RND transporter periplasmic adaptor subunit [Alphaproteobacteria bacterium]|nr:efflux RND transporter periplasmic adaptor subunit [Alphaproteobacteria bacterium]
MRRHILGWLALTAAAVLALLFAGPAPIEWVTTRPAPPPVAMAPDAPPSAAGGRRVIYYRNPMGLADVSPKPKKDSMGMDFIPVFEDEVLGPAGSVRIGPERVQRAGVRTEPVSRRVLTRRIKAAGTVTADESRVAVVTAKFDGFVETLHVPLTGTAVRAGQPLMRVWIESPDILRKQADYLTALRGSARVGDLAKTEQNLRLFGLSDQVIARLRETGEAVRALTLTAPTTGTVMEKPALVGMRFAAGDMLFKVTDLSTVWVMAQVAERDLGWLRIGQTARIVFRAFAEQPIEGEVAFIYPELNMMTRTASVRIVLGNPDGRIKTGLYGDVTIEAQASDSPVIAIPDSAIIDSGSRRVAFVAKGDGLFEPRQLALGRRGNGLVEVLDGLEEGERLVVTGNFLIDAESNLRAALSGFGPPKVEP